MDNVSEIISLPKAVTVEIDKDGFIKFDDYRVEIVFIDIREFQQARASQK